MLFNFKINWLKMTLPQPDVNCVRIGQLINKSSMHNIVTPIISA